MQDGEFLLHWRIVNKKQVKGHALFHFVHTEYIFGIVYGAALVKYNAEKTMIHAIRYYLQRVGCILHVTFCQMQNREYQMQNREYQIQNVEYRNDHAFLQFLTHPPSFSGTDCFSPSIRIFLPTAVIWTYNYFSLHRTDPVIATYHR